MKTGEEEGEAAQPFILLATKGSSTFLNIGK